MRVGYLTNSYPKVSHTFIRREIQELERQGVEVTRFSIRGWDNVLVDPEDLRERDHTFYLLRKGIVPLATAVLRCLVSNPIGFLKAVALAFRIGWRSNRPLATHVIYLAEACLLALWMEKQGLEHLHVHFGTNPATVAMLLGVVANVSWSFTVHGPEEFDKPDLIALAEKVRRCRFVVAISAFGRSQLFRLVDHSIWNKVKVVHCGVGSELLDSELVPISASPRLVCVGRLCEQKGQLLLLRAARQLAAEGQTFEVVLAGDGELRSEVDTLIEKYCLRDRVRVTGWLTATEIIREITAARALVLPSFAEGLPVAIMEAMALGRPVISTYVAGIPELVCPGVHGWLIPAGDVEALVSAMRECLCEPAQIFETRSTQLRERVALRHGIEQQVAKLVWLFSNAA